MYTPEYLEMIDKKNVRLIIHSLTNITNLSIGWQSRSKLLSSLLESDVQLKTGSSPFTVLSIKFVSIRKSCDSSTLLERVLDSGIVTILI